MHRLLPTHPIDGCFLGDPKGAVGEKRIFIKGTTEIEVRAHARKQEAKVLASPEAAECVFHEKINGRGLMHSTGGEKALESRNY